MNPSIFIGSSSEALPIAKNIQDVLSKQFKVEVWSDDIFALGQDNLDNLLKFAQCYDFAILIVTGDDVTKSRKATSVSPRDNVLLELGLFMGALGRRRTFPIIVEGLTGTPKLPSDILGNTCMFLKHPISAGIELEIQLSKLIRAIQERSKESFLHLLPSTALAIGYYQNFVLPVCQELARRDTVTVGTEETDISKDNYDFTIVLPHTLSDSSIHGANKFVKEHGFASFALPVGSRSYPFYVGAEAKKGRVMFYDYPTTLNASKKAITLALSRSSIGVSKEMQLLEERELCNFKQTIEALFLEPEAAEFRNNIRFLHL